MNQKDIIRYRLINQQISKTHFSQPEEVVSWLGAMQSQDWAMANWAIGLRIPKSSVGDIETAFNEGRILRIHILRPTWHFVTPADIRWMLQLTAPHVHQLNTLYYRKFELNNKLLSKCNDIMVKLLRDQNYQTREEINNSFSKAKIKADRLRLSYIMMHAELDGLICSGPRQGKQFTYALLDERAKQIKPLHRDEALRELTARYFTSRGPATLKDFVWWSGMKVKDAKDGTEMLGRAFTREKINDSEYIFKLNQLNDLKKGQATFLIPDYDEYGIGYKDRSLYNHPKWKNATGKQHPDYYHAIAVDGFHGGNWKKTMKGDKPNVEIALFDGLTKVQISSVEKAVKKYLGFFS